MRPKAGSVASQTNLLAASAVRRTANPGGVSVTKRRCIKRSGAQVFQALSEVFIIAPCAVPEMIDYGVIIVDY